MYRVENLKSDSFSYREDVLKLAGMPVTKSAVKDLCAQRKVPYGLFAFQERTPIEIIDPIFKSLGDLKAVIKDDEVKSFVHPSKEFVSDENLALIEEKVQALELPDFSLFGFDTFSSKGKVTRPLTGGVNISLGITRLVCSNGATVFHPACSTSYADMPNLTVTGNALEKLKEFTPEEYLNSVFGDKSQLRPASVLDLKSIALASELPEDELSLYFPLSLVREHYAQKGYDIDKLSTKTLSQLPAGVTFYDAFNFLTYVISHKIEKDKVTDAQIRASKFLGRASAKDYEHLLLAGTKIEAPHIPGNLIVRMKGDN